MKVEIVLEFANSSSRHFRDAMALATRFPELVEGDGQVPNRIVLSEEAFDAQLGKLRRLWRIIGKWKQSRIWVQLSPQNGTESLDDASGLLTLDWQGMLEAEAEEAGSEDTGASHRPIPVAVPEEEAVAAKRHVPTTTYKEIGGIDSLLQTIREVVELPIRHPEIFEHLKLKPHRGVLMQGPPGCGKTLIAKAIANEVKAHFISIRGPELISKYQGESESNLRAVFEEARMFAPAIIFFDEIDAIAQRRSGNETLQHEARFVNQFLTLLDGFDEASGVFVLASTNRADLLDPALMRPGRLDVKLEIPYPDLKGCEQIFKIHSKGKPFEPRLNLKKFSQGLLGKSGADIAYVVREAAYNCLRRSLDLKQVVQSDEPLNGEMKGLKISKADLDTALAQLEAQQEISPVNHDAVLSEISDAMSNKS